MSDYQGNIIIKNPAAPAGPVETGAAPGVWKLSEVLPFVRQGIWPTPGIAGPDPYFPYVSLLLSTTSLNNANNNLFVDSSGAFNPVSRNGNTTQGSFSPYSTNWSNYFDGSGDSLSGPSWSSAGNFGTGDFTVEGWFYAVSAPQSNNVIWSCNIYPNSTGIYLRYFGGGSTDLDVRYGSSGLITASAGWSLNQWHHVAVVRSSGTVTLYIDGVSRGSASFTNNCTDGLQYIGRPSDTSNYAFHGYVSNFRIVKGTAVYTSAFTPSTSPLTAISGTSLLTCQNNRFIDNSSNAFAITRNGDVRVTDYGPFSPTYPGASYNQSDITNWSGYFAGNEDFLTSPDNAAVQLGSGDFTIEMWVYFSAAMMADQQVLLFNGSNANSYGPYKLFYNGANNLKLYGSTNGSSWDIFNGLDVITTVVSDCWYHIALVRSGSTFSAYANGVRQSTASVSGSLVSTGTPVRIGAADAFGSYNFLGFISNLRMVKGTAVYNPASSTITVPTTNLTAISGTSLLTLQNAAFTDNSTNNFVISQVGQVTVTGNSPFNTVGYWSNYFDGSGDYLSAPSNAAFAYGTGNFTVELWFFASSVSGAEIPIYKQHNGGAAAGDTVEIRIASSKIYGYIENTSFGGTTTLSPNTWYHVAYVRNGSTCTLYLNGVSEGSASNSLNISTNPTTVRLGTNQVTANFFTGYISNARVVKGTAVYTGAFTPPTAPLTAISGTSLLTCQNGRFIDNSANAFTITANGNTSTQSFDPFYTSTIASNGGSMYFDGSGDWLDAPSSSSLGLSTGSFTVEGWIYPTSTASNALFWGSTTSGALFIRLGQYGGTAYSGIQIGRIGVANDTFSAFSFTAGQWYHIAVVRNGSTMTIYVNGTSINSFSNTTDYGSSATARIGATESGGENYAGYISNLRVVKGTAVYTSAFTPPTAPVTPTPATTLLVNGMNAGVYDATTINDMETVGNAQVRYFLGNYYAGSFDGSGDYLSTATSAAIALGTSDFTLECWVYPSAYPNDSTLIGVGTTSTGNEITLQIRNGQVASHLFISGSHSDVQFTDLPVSLNTWSHLAISRVSGVLYGFLNGVRSTVTQALTTNFGSSASVTVAPSDRYAGSLSNARITKNVAIYSTATYTVPTSPLTPTSNTAFLTCQNTTFIDNSPNALAITVNGGATAGATGPFTYTRGNSVFLDATDDCLTFPASPNLALGSAAFTIEAWVYLTTLAGTKPIIECRTSGGSASGYALLVNSTGNLNVYTSGAFLGASSTALSANTWNHVALVRSGTGSNQTTYYINGVASGTITMSGNFTDATSTVTRVGASTTAGELWPGYIDDLRVTRGVARYTSNFTPSNNPFPPY